MEIQYLKNLLMAVDTQIQLMMNCIDLILERENIMEEFNLAKL